MGKPIVHFEIGCRDREATSRFYQELFDWEIKGDGPAAMIDTKSPTGIQGHITSLGHAPHNYLTVYAEVDDLASALKRAEELGAKTTVPPTEVQGMGQFAWIADPEGTLFGLWKPLNR